VALGHSRAVRVTLECHDAAAGGQRGGHRQRTHTGECSELENCAGAGDDDQRLQQPRL
jgi:hypothetical protein